MKLTNILGILPLISASSATTPSLPSYDTTWAGPVQIAENFNTSSNTTGFQSVQATLVIPRLKLPHMPHQQVNQYTAAFWIGLDGFISDADNSIRGLWQSGVVMSVWTNGTTEYSGFYEWVPNDPVSLTSSQLAISEDDHVQVIINTTNSGYHGTTTLMNLNTSQSFSYSQDAPTAWRGPTFPAPGSSAEWIMEAGTYLNGTQYNFPDWGNASIIDASACYESGQCVVLGDPGMEIAAVLWNDTRTVYTKTYVDEDRVWIAYVEESLDSLS